MKDFELAIKYFFWEFLTDQFRLQSLEEESNLILRYLNQTVAFGEL